MSNGFADIFGGCLRSSLVFRQGNDCGSPASKSRQRRPRLMTPGAMEWQALHAGGEERNSASPWATGSEETEACIGAYPTFVPGILVPETMMGRGASPDYRCD